MENKMSDLDKMVTSKENELSTKLDNNVKKNNYIKKNNDVKKELDVVEKQRDKLLLELNQSNEEKNIFRDKLKRTEDELNKTRNGIDKKKLNHELINVKKDLDKKIFNITKLKDELTKKNKNIKILEDNSNNLNTKKNEEIRELQEELENTHKFIYKKMKKIIN